MVLNVYISSRILYCMFCPLGNSCKAALRDLFSGWFGLQFIETLTIIASHQIFWGLEPQIIGGGEVDIHCSK